MRYEGNMKKHRSIEERIRDYKPKLPEKAAFDLIRLGMRLSLPRGSVKLFYHFDTESFRNKQVILLADHAAFDSFIPVIGGWKLGPFNIVAGRCFCSSRIGLFICNRLGLIPKSSYQTDFSSLRQMLSILNRGGSLLFFPEGIPGMSGSSMPINPGTVSFLKGVRLPVILARSKGYALLHPVYAREKRRGYAELHYELLFTSEELREKDEEALYQKLWQHFRHNDYEWNEQHHHRYKTKNGLAAGLEKLLYLCPACGQEMMMRSEHDDIFCTSCGNRIRVGEDYQLVPDPGCILPYRNIDDWVKAQRRKVREEIEDANFHIEYDCRVYSVHARSMNLLHPYAVVGTGHLQIDANGIQYRGSYEGKTVELFFSIADTPSFFVIPMNYPFNCLYESGVWYGFEPVDHDVNLVKNCIAVEELHNRMDLVWNRVSRDAYDE